MAVEQCQIRGGFVAIIQKFALGSSLLKSKFPYYNLKFLVARDPSGHNNDGDGNNANDRGVHDGTFIRFTNSYADGIGQLRGQHLMTDPGGGKSIGIDDPLLPAARAVSDAVMNQGTQDIPNSFGVNEFFQFFGQALTHDMAEAATGASGDPPILLPIFGPPGVTSGLPFPVNRTPYEEGVTTPRQQINEETSFLDLSMVYGNNQALLDLVRANKYDKYGNKIESAKLLMGADDLLPTIQQVADENGLSAVDVLRIFTAPGFGGLPDPDVVQNLIDNPNLPDPTGLRPNPADPTNWVNNYFAGDNRVNQTPLLISQQVIWAREHNYQVDKLTPYAKKYGWTEDQLFEAARAITEAEWQHVVYNEYLPKLIGTHALSEYKGYNKNVDPSIINEFTTVAFRFGHDQSSQTQQPLNEDGSHAAPGGLTIFTLATAFLAGANGARTAEDLDAWIRGQLSAHTQEIDGLVVDGNRNLLFGIGVNGPVTDLEVFDIMRARDHGVASYNELRKGMGLSEYDSFEAYAAANGIDTSSARYQALVDVYGGDINKLDAIIGGLLEQKYYDSQLGETFTKLIAYQFENLRDGDQLYYENRFANDPKLLAEIESTSLADILKRTTGIEHIYRDAFAAHDRIGSTDGSIEGSSAKDLAIGSKYNELIRTYDGDDDIYAGAGNDVISAGGGNDWIWGGPGKDIFIFEEYSGKDVVKDFSVRDDKLDLTDYGIDTWKEAKSLIKKTSTGVILRLDNDNSVELVGVKTLTKNNFIYDHDHDYGFA
jgi:peroxidase